MLLTIVTEEMRLSTLCKHDIVGGETTGAVGASLDINGNERNERMAGWNEHKAISEVSQVRVTLTILSSEYTIP